MDKFAEFPGGAPLWALLLVLAIIAIVLIRIVRSRPTQATAPVPDRPSDDTDFLDSSHVGGPIFAATDSHPELDVDGSARRAKPGSESGIGRG